MNSDMKGRNILAIALVIIVIILVVTLIVVGLYKNNNGGEGNVPTAPNYIVQADGTKVNTTSKVQQTKKVNDLVIENSKVVYENGVTKLNAKVINNGEKIDNLSFNIKFIANDNSIVYEMEGYVGTIDKAKTSYIASSVTRDIVDVKDITYEIKK